MSRKIRWARADARRVTIPRRNETQGEEREVDNRIFRAGNLVYRLMECNRTLASHRLCRPSRSSSRLLPFFPFRSPPRASDAFADFSLCPCARFVLVARDTRAMAERESASEVSSRYFKRCSPAPAFISAAFISIYAAVLETGQLARRGKSRGAGRSARASNRRCLVSYRCHVPRQR